MKARDTPKKDYGDLISDAIKPKQLPETAWWKVGAAEDLSKGIMFEGAWGNLGTDGGITYAPASWHQSHHGEVRHRGVVTGGNIGETIYVVPEEDRIEFSQVFVCAVIGGGTANVRVDPDGSVVLESLS